MYASSCNHLLLAFVVKGLNDDRLSVARFSKGSTWETVTIMADENNDIQLSLSAEPVESTLRGKNNMLRNERSEKPNLSLSIKEQINVATRECAEFQSTEYVDCVANQMVASVEAISKSKTDLITHRDKISARLRNYTCADPNMQSPDPIEVFPMHLDGRDLIVSRHLDTTHAQILTAENFISDEECSILEEYGSTRLQRATVAAEDGTSTVSKSRQAQQAGYEISGVDDPLW